jgi:hypothetical protein
MVLAVSGRDLIEKETGVAWWSFWKYMWNQTPSPQPKMDKIKHLMEIYNQMLSTLTEKTYNGNIEKARARIVVLVTHMDMIAPEKRNVASGEIKAQFKGKY